MLLDVMMPGLDGFQTLKFVIHKAKTERISCKVIMFTNLSGSDNERKASESGASGYITKANYTPKEAVAFVMDVLEGSEKEPEAPSMESRIEEDSDGRYFADCPDCSAKMEIVVDENGKPVTVKLEHRENQ